MVIDKYFFCCHESFGRHATTSFVVIDSTKDLKCLSVFHFFSRRRQQFLINRCQVGCSTFVNWYPMARTINMLELELDYRDSSLLFRSLGSGGGGRNK